MRYPWETIEPLVKEMISWSGVGSELYTDTLSLSWEATTKDCWKSPQHLVFSAMRAARIGWWKARRNGSVDDHLVRQELAPIADNRRAAAEYRQLRLERVRGLASRRITALTAREAELAQLYADGHTRRSAQAILGVSAPRVAQLTNALRLKIESAAVGALVE